MAGLSSNQWQSSVLIEDDRRTYHDDGTLMTQAAVMVMTGDPVAMTYCISDDPFPCSLFIFWMEDSVRTVMISMAATQWKLRLCQQRDINGYK